MKRIPYLLLILLVVLISACSDDDDNSNINQQENFLKIGNQEYELKAGIIEDIGLYQDEIYSFDITLINANLISIGGEVIPDQQTITAILFELFTDSAEGLKIGQYDFVDFADIGPQTFEYAVFVENVNINSDIEEQIENFIVSGTLNVLSVSPEYEFEFEGLDNQGQEVTFYYKGNLMNIN